MMVLWNRYVFLLMVLWNRYIVVAVVLWNRYIFVVVVLWNRYFLWQWLCWWSCEIVTFLLVVLWNRNMFLPMLLWNSRYVYVDNTDVLACTAVSFSVWFHIVTSGCWCFGSNCAFNVLVLFFGAGVLAVV